LVGAGVFYTAIGQDTRIIQGRDVFVAGGGNSAGQAVVHLAKNARKVVQLVRGHSLGEHMSDYLVQEILHSPNVAVMLDTEVVDAGGDHSLERITVRSGSSAEQKTFDAEVLFVLIGAEPHTRWLEGAVARDRHGFILTGDGVPVHLRQKGEPLAPFETSLPGVFAVGDVRAGSVKRVASAVGEGASAVQQVHDYLARVGGEAVEDVRTVSIGM